MILNVLIVNPDSVIFEGTVQYLLVPTITGVAGLMPSHTPLFTELIKGDIVLSGEKEEIVAIEGGILRIKDDSVTILTN
jgi:F-type H+-transporting ATPase subunit epsilon